MSNNLIPPKRTEPYVDKDGNLTKRNHRFLVDVALLIPDQMEAIDDITVSSTANNTAKINELLASLRTSGALKI